MAQNQFKPSKFKELRGNIFVTVLETILEETKQANSIGIDKDVCSYVIRSMHGLLCAHTIAEYIAASRPIPLDYVHPHWCKLDMLATEISTTKSRYQVLGFHTRDKVDSEVVQRV